MTPERAKKGTVAIQTIKGRLRLCWSYSGKRYFLAMGLDATKLNQPAAQMIASRIEEDIRTQNFDPTLKKYKAPEKQSEITVVALLDRYIRFKKASWQQATLEKYNATLAQLKDFFGQSPANINSREATGFVAQLYERQKPATVRDRLSILKACWNWGMLHQLVAENPWQGVQLKRTSAPRPQPFTENEVRRILDYFKKTPKLQHYYELVEFRLRTGMRTGEIAGLQWKHLSKDCSVIQVSSAITRRERKATKTGKSREFALSSTVQALLLKRRSPSNNPDDLVFPGMKGAAIDPNNFARNQWKPTLETLEIPYRRPYITRSTFVSHALENGVSPSQVAEISGHDQATMFRHYAGSIKRHQLPELWD